MSWECPECGSNVNDKYLQCDCGYREENLIPTYNVKNSTTQQYEQNQQKTNSEIKHKKAKSFFKKLIIFFVAFNLFTYGSFIARQSIGHPHFAGKALVASAFLTSMMYVTPLLKVFGPESFIVAPFDGTKKTLLSLGKSFFPKNDAEGALHAYGVEKYEWDSFYNIEFKKIARGKKRTSPDIYISLTESLFSLLEPLASMPLKDEKLRTKRLLHFLVAADRYIWLRARTLEIIASTRKNTKEQSLSNHPFVSNQKEMRRLRQILGWYKHLKEFCQKNEKTAYDLLESRNHPAWCYESQLLYDATLWLNARSILTNSLLCTDPEIKLFLDNREILLKDVINSDNVPEKHKKIIINELQNSSAKNIYKFVFFEIQKECFEKK